MELKLLNGAYLSRDVWEKLSDTSWSDQGAILFSMFSEFYENDEQAKYVDKDILFHKLERAFPKHYKMLQRIVEGFDEELSIPNINREIVEHKRHVIGTRLASALIEGNDRDIAIYMEEFNSVQEEEIEEDNPFDYSLDVFSVYDRENLIKIFPNSLNDKVDGGVVKGTHILIFARPEMGKSMFAINMAAGFASQGLKGLYFTNEDPAKVVRNRLLNRLSGMNRYECFDNKEKALSIAKEKGLGNIAVVDIAPGTPREIEGYISKYNPDWIVVDQVRNLRATDNSGDGGLVHSLESNATAMRNMAKKHDIVVVSVTQAGDSATGKAALTMSDVDSSKTGLPAQVDLMVGMGATEDMNRQGQRMLSICKNKITGDHSFFPVQVDEALSKVVSL